MRGALGAVMADAIPRGMLRGREGAPAWAIVMVRRAGGDRPPVYSGPAARPIRARRRAHRRARGATRQPTIARTTVMRSGAIASGARMPRARRPARSSVAWRPSGPRSARRPARWPPATSLADRRRPWRSGRAAAPCRAPPPGRRPAPASPPASARRRVAYSRPTTNAPASRVGPRAVSHQGLRCMATRRAPPRTRRKARSRFSKVSASGGVADHDRGTVAARCVRGLGLEQPLAGKLGARVRRAEQVQRSAREAPRASGPRSRRAR